LFVISGGGSEIIRITGKKWSDYCKGSIAIIKTGGRGKKYEYIYKK
jgi:hypothetical protein